MCERGCYVPYTRIPSQVGYIKGNECKIYPILSFVLAVAQPSSVSQSAHHGCSCTLHSAYTTN